MDNLADAFREAIEAELEAVAYAMTAPECAVMDKIRAVRTHFTTGHLYQRLSNMAHALIVNPEGTIQVHGWVAGFTGKPPREGESNDPEQGLRINIGVLNTADNRVLVAALGSGVVVRGTQLNLTPLPVQRELAEDGECTTR